MESLDFKLLRVFMLAYNDISLLAVPLSNPLSSPLSCGLFLLNKGTVVLDLLFRVVAEPIVWHYVVLTTYLALCTVLLFMCLPVPVLDLAPFCFPHLLVLLGVLQLLHLLLCVFVLLIVELLRRDPLNEDQFVLLKLETIWALALKGTGDLHFPHPLLLSFPAKMAVEINHETETYEQEQNEDH